MTEDSTPISAEEKQAEPPANVSPINTSGNATQLGNTTVNGGTNNELPWQVYGNMAGNYSAAYSLIDGATSTPNQFSFQTRDRENVPYKHEAVKIYLGHIDATTIDHRLRNNIEVYLNGEKMDERFIQEAKDGEHGWLKYIATDENHVVLPGPVYREKAGHVHFMLKENSGLTEFQIKMLRDPSNGRSLDRVSPPATIEECFKPKQRRVSRLHDSL